MIFVNCYRHEISSISTKHFNATCFDVNHHTYRVKSQNEVQPLFMNDLWYMICRKQAHHLSDIMFPVHILWNTKLSDELAIFSIFIWLKKWPWNTQLHLIKFNWIRCYQVILKDECIHYNFLFHSIFYITGLNRLNVKLQYIFLIYTTFWNI